MIEFIRQKKILILVVLITLAGIISIGYQSAEQKSEPIYRSKIDRIMYDTHNQSPKYVITLPDRNKKSKKPEEVVSVGEEASQAETTAKPQKEEDPHSLEAVIARTPYLASLGSAGGQPLPAVRSDSDLTEEKGNLKLPKTDGKKKPWEVYGSKVSVMPRFNRIAVVIKNMGLNRGNADLINKGLPSGVSFSFSPYAPDQAEQIIAARSEGHETYMDLLLPSKDYLQSDSGPMSISLTASLAENTERLEKTIGIGAPVGGVIVTPGVADESNAEHLTAILQELHDRGLLVLNATGEDGIEAIKVRQLARARADIVIDRDFSAQNIEKLLEQAEQIARDKGYAVIVSDPKPIAVLALNKWIESFSPQLSYEEMKERNITEIAKPFALVPLSNLVVEE